MHAARWRGAEGWRVWHAHAGCALCAIMNTHPIVLPRPFLYSCPAIPFPAFPSLALHSHPPFPPACMLLFIFLPAYHSCLPAMLACLPCSPACDAPLPAMLACLPCSPACHARLPAMLACLPCSPACHARLPALPVRLQLEGAGQHGTHGGHAPLHQGAGGEAGSSQVPGWQSGLQEGEAATPHDHEMARKFLVLRSWDVACSQSTTPWVHMWCSHPRQPVMQAARGPHLQAVLLHAARESKAALLRNKKLCSKVQCSKKPTKQPPATRAPSFPPLPPPTCALSSHPHLFSSCFACCLAG